MSRVLLVYGTSSYNGFPYRHPCVTSHEVTHENDSAQLSEGQLVTTQMLADLMTELARTVPIEIFPECVLARTPDVIAWWLPPCRRTMFFSDRGGDPALTKLNGGKYPQPALVFKVSGSSLWVRALVRNERPKADTPLYRAPYWNCYDDGSVCTGSMVTPRNPSVRMIDEWEQSFFASEFTHAAGASRRTRYPGGLLALWQSVEGVNVFPSRYLVRANQTLEEWIINDEQKGRNRNFDREE